MSPEKLDPPAESLWATEIERRAREVADVWNGKENGLRVSG
jgi:hypothetical protein